MSHELSGWCGWLGAHRRLACTAERTISALCGYSGACSLSHVGPPGFVSIYSASYFDLMAPLFLVFLFYIYTSIYIYIKKLIEPRSPP